MVLEASHMNTPESTLSTCVILSREVTSIKPVDTLDISIADIRSLASAMSTTLFPLNHTNTGTGDPRAVHVRVVGFPSGTIRSTTSAGNMMLTGAVVNSVVINAISNSKPVF